MKIGEIIVMKRIDKLNVLVLTYNRLKYLEMCVESLLKSDFPIVLNIWDNGSTDGTKEWIDEKCIRNNRLTGLFFNSQKNVGTAIARNAAIDVFNDMDVEYLLISDDDIYYKTDCIRYNVDMLNKFNDEGIYKIGIVGLAHPFSSDGYKKRIYLDEKKIDRYLVHFITITPPNSWIINCNAIIDSGGFHLPKNKLMGYSAFHLPDKMRQLDFHFVRISHVGKKSYMGAEHTDVRACPLNHIEYYKEYNLFRHLQKYGDQNAKNNANNANSGKA